MANINPNELPENNRQLARVAEQNDVIQRIQDKLDEAEETVCFTKMSNRTLHVTINELQKELEEKENLKNYHTNMNLSLKNDILQSTIDLSLKKKKSQELKDLEEKLDLSMAAREQFTKEYESESQAWYIYEKLQNSYVKYFITEYDYIQRKLAEYEKAIGKMRVERNQREALVNKLQRDLEKVKAKKHSVEIETKNAKQLLSESQQIHKKLQKEADALQKAKKELLCEVGMLDAFKCTDLKRSEVLKLQLQQICSHIQESEKLCEETISRFHSQLLMVDEELKPATQKAEENFNPGSSAPGKEILKHREEPHSSSKL